MFTKEEKAIIEQAKAILLSKVNNNQQLTDPEQTKDFFRISLSSYEYEVFAVLFLNTRNQMIKYHEIFRGTIDQAAVYPREIAKEALFNNAFAVIVGHNHPSGNTEPSRADERITQSIRMALKLLDVVLLDHIIVGVGETTSMAERGMI